MNSSKVAFSSVLSNTFIVILKVVIGIFTGSVAILSEAIHSSLDLLASIIAFLSEFQINQRINYIPMDMEK